MGLLPAGVLCAFQQPKAAGGCSATVRTQLSAKAAGCQGWRPCMPLADWCVHLLRRQQLAESKVQLQSEALARDQMEADMKKAFMRGRCTPKDAYCPG